jgi:dienelactone hydrolase
MIPTRLSICALVLFVAASAHAEAEKVTGANYALATKFNRDFIRQHVQEATVLPTFIGKTDQFWYSVRTPAGTKFWRVDPTRKSKEPLFDAAKLAAQLSEAIQKPLDTATMDITRVTVTDDGAKMRFVASDTQFEYEFAAAKLTKLGKAPPAPRTFPKGDMDDRTRELLLERMREERDRMDREEDRKDDIKKDDELKDDEKKVDEKVDEKKDDGKKDTTTTRGKRGFGGPTGPGGRGTLDYKAYSPDRKRFVFAQKFNLYLADETKEAEAVQLTTDGEEDYSFSGFGGGFGGRFGGRTTTTEAKIPSDRKTRPNVTWSPDSKGFFVTRTDSRGIKELYLVDSLAQPRPTMTKYKYPMPGEDAVRKSELFYCDAAAKTITKVKPKWAYERYDNIHWNKTGDELRFQRHDRLQRHLEFCSLNTKTGEDKCLLAEGFEAAFLEHQQVRYLDESDEMIWWSERSGWGHFYLYGRDGKLKNAITSGGWRCSRIVDVDVKNRLLYFVGNGREPGENVYYNHLYRVRLDGTDLTLLDPSDTCFTHHDEYCRGANHSSYLSPSKRYIVTTCSRVDNPPMSYVLDEKGGRVMDLENTDLTALQKAGWKLPETFCVKAADGVTTLWGNMWKPFDFDPKKKYPIIAHVYPGPQQEGVTHTFTAYSTNMQLAQLGFIVVQVGHRGGTPTRSKAYHSYGYFNLRDYALADKKAAIEELAARYSFMDVERVGIYGHSGGGFLSAAALLQKPYNDFFKVAVASAGNHDNNIYNDNWSERYHGLKEIAAEAKDAKDGKKDIPPAKPWDDEGDPQDKGTAKSSDSKSDVKKSEEKKSDAKAVETKRSESKDGAKKEDTRKAEMKTADAKTEKGELKKDDKATAKKEDGPPKVKYEIKVPTNAELAANLKGHLLLVHGDMDNNVHPANTLRLVDALIKANKRFDMLILPGKSHGFADEQPYFTQRMWEYFAEYLLDDRQTSADISEKKSGRK